MRQFQSRQPQPVQEPVRPTAHAHAHAYAPARAAATKQDVENERLDRAAALWTTRRIRSFFLLLEQPSRTPQR